MKVDSKVKARSREYKRYFDAVIRQKKRLPESDIAPLAIYFLWWAIETGNSKDFETARWLRDVAATSALEAAAAPADPRAFDLLTYLYLGIWKELGIESPIIEKSARFHQQALRRSVKAAHAREHNTELISGSAGVGTVALQFGDVETVRSCVRYIESQLIETKVGRLLKARPDYINVSFKGKVKGDVILSGIAHGLSGPVLFLINVYEAFGDERARKLADVLVTSFENLMASQGEGGEGFRDGYKLEGKLHGRSLSWCMGSAGVAVTISRAARIARTAKARFRREQLATLLSRYTVAQLDHATGLDLHVCHGRGGILQSIRRIDPDLYRETNLDRLLTAKMTPRTICRVPNPHSSTDRFDSYEVPSFISGPLGVAFVLKQSTSSFEMPWDRHLLLSGLDKRWAETVPVPDGWRQ